MTPVAAVKRGAPPTPSNTPAVGASTLGRLLSFNAEGLGTPDENGRLVSWQGWSVKQDAARRGLVRSDLPAAMKHVHCPPGCATLCIAHAGADCCHVQELQQVPALQERRFARSVSIPPSLSGSRSRVSSPTSVVGEPQCLTLTCWHGSPLPGRECECALAMLQHLLLCQPWGSLVRGCALCRCQQVEPDAEQGGLGAPQAAQLNLWATECKQQQHLARLCRAHA